MVVRSPFLLGLSCQTLLTRVQALQAACPDADVQRMVEYYPSLLEVSTCCKSGCLAVLYEVLLVQWTQPCLTIVDCTRMLQEHKSAADVH